VWRIPTEASQALGALAERSMQLQATIQEGNLLLSMAGHRRAVEVGRFAGSSDGAG
jgi:uncharacterized protein YaeQ